MPKSDVWLIDPYDMTREWMGETEKNLRINALALVEKYRAEIESAMKRNAAWTDRTGNLRQTLYADIDLTTPDTITLYFDYGLYYGIYLEFRADLAGRFAIVNPTFDFYAPKFLDEVTNLLNNL